MHTLGEKKNKSADVKAKCRVSPSVLEWFAQHFGIFSICLSNEFMGNAGISHFRPGKPRKTQPQFLTGSAGAGCQQFLHRDP